MYQAEIDSGEMFLRELWGEQQQVFSFVQFLILRMRFVLVALLQ